MIEQEIIHSLLHNCNIATIVDDLKWLVNLCKGASKLPQSDLMPCQVQWSRVCSVWNTYSFLLTHLVHKLWLMPFWGVKLG